VNNVCCTHGASQSPRTQGAPPGALFSAPPHRGAARKQKSEQIKAISGAAAAASLICIKMGGSRRRSFTLHISPLDARHPPTFCQVTRARTTHIFAFTHLCGADKRAKGDARAHIVSGKTLASARAPHAEHIAFFNLLSALSRAALIK
jgi:hypothetical protein